MEMYATTVLVKKNSQPFHFKILFNANLKYVVAEKMKQTINQPSSQRPPKKSAWPIKPMTSQVASNAG